MRPAPEVTRAVVPAPLDSATANPGVTVVPVGRCHTPMGSVGTKTVVLPETPKTAPAPGSTWILEAVVSGDTTAAVFPEIGETAPAIGSTRTAEPVVKDTSKGVPATF